MRGHAPTRWTPTPSGARRSASSSSRYGLRGGLQLHGDEDDTEAIVDLFIHLKAIFESNGKTLQVHAIGGDG